MRVTRAETGSATCQVTMDIAARVAEKLQVVDKVVKTAKLVMKDSANNATISISGAPRVRIAMTGGMCHEHQVKAAGV